VFCFLFVCLFFTFALKLHSRPRPRLGKGRFLSGRNWGQISARFVEWFWWEGHYNQRLD